MCLPRDRRLRACRSLCRSARVAIKTRGFEAMCRSTGPCALQSSDSADACSFAAGVSGLKSARRVTVGARPGVTTYPMCNTQNMLALRSQAADSKRPLFIATHAEISSRSVASAKLEQCGFGRR
eukprot:6200605-Pleurochrysis_carterae.AAC.1